MNTKHDNNSKKTTFFSARDVLVCATQGEIHAVDKVKGVLLWTCNPLSEPFGDVISLFVTDTNKVIAGLQGKTICIDLNDGKLLWENEMKELNSSEEVSVLSSPSRFFDIKGFSTDTYGEQTPPKYVEKTQCSDDSVVISCTDRNVMAMNIKTGETIWTYHCTGGRRSFSSVLICEPVWNDKGSMQDLVYIGVGQWIHCLNAKTGALIWELQVSQNEFGYKYMTLATICSSRTSAETNTCFSQQPVVYSKRNKERGSQKSGINFERTHAGG